MRKTTIYLKCPDIETDRIPFIYSEIEDWVRSPELLKLVESFGVKILDALPIEDFVKWLSEFSELWDFRKLQQEAKEKNTNENARWLLNDSHITPDQKELIEKASRILGLVGVSEPSKHFYDYILALGGARLSCLLRPQFAAELIKEKKVDTKGIIMLASSRPVSNSERDATDTYAPGALDEYDLINAGIEKSFRLTNGFTEEHSDTLSHINKRWAIRKYNADEKKPIIVSISAPSSEPEKRRANSSDTYEFFISKFNIPQSSSLLLVTSQIYVPYQQLEAIRTLAIPHNVIVETIGFPIEWNSNLQGMLGLSNYLQEIRSTIQSINRFLGQYPYRK
jgi:hypothetical protein